MSPIRFTLHSDGSSDKRLIPILTWVLRQHLPDTAIGSGAWADLRLLRKPPQGLEARLRVCLDLYPCDLLFVHRDAEREDPERRRAEISRAIQNITPVPPVVCVVPVRMQEAWLLFDELAIRRAAGNPRGRGSLNMPSLSRVEAIPDPKELLYELLRDASGLRGRKLYSFRPSQSADRLVELISDFTPLQKLLAFSRLQQDVATILDENPQISN